MEVNQWDGIEEKEGEKGKNKEAKRVINYRPQVIVIVIVVNLIFLVVVTATVTAMILSHVYINIT